MDGELNIRTVQFSVSWNISVWLRMYLWILSNIAYLKLDPTWDWCKQYFLLAGAKDRWAKIPVYQPADGKPAWRPSYRPDNRPTTTTSIPTTRGTTTTTTTHRPYHRHHHHHNNSPPQIPNGKPDTCDTSYDAVSVIRRELFVFKGQVRIQCCL